MPKPSGLRKDPRELLNSEVSLSWEDARGVHRLSKGKCVNISERGLRVLVSDEIPVRSYVSFRVKSLRFSGGGSVRNARRQGLRFEIGIEFSGALRLPQIAQNKATETA